MNPPSPKHVLLCGHRSFAAQGLAERLERSGHRLTLFSRGPVGREGNQVAGPVTEMHANPHLDAAYDTAINFIVLKNESVSRNLEYVQSLLRLCREKAITHLVHLSSMSVYRDSLDTITEDAPIKTDPSASGPYAALKIAADLHLLAHTPAHLKLTLIRPAYVLSPGMADPIGSVGLRLPWRQVLIMGIPARQRPIISRGLLIESIGRVVSQPPLGPREVLLLVDRDSPTCGEYIQGCCERLGLARRAQSVPKLIWVPLFVVREIVKGMRGKWIERSVRSICYYSSMQTYDPTATEERLGLSLRTDWKVEIG